MKEEEMYLKVKLSIADSLINTNNQIYQEVGGLDAKIKELDKGKLGGIHKKTLDLLKEKSKELHMKCNYLMLVKDIMDDVSLETFKGGN